MIFFVYEMAVILFKERWGDANFGLFWTTPILQPVHIAIVALVADAIHDRNRVIHSCPNMEVIFA